MQVHFSVPQYPAFRATQTVVEHRQYLSYLTKFEQYATTAIAAQVRASRDLVVARGVKEEIAEVRKIAQDMCASVSGLPVRLEDKIESVSAEVCQQVKNVCREVSGVDTSGVTSDKNEPVVEVLQPRGKWYASNRLKKEKQRAVRQSLQSTVDTGRVVEADKVVQNDRVGYFSGCSEEVRRDLRDSRARMLVERNNLHTVKAAAEKTRLEARVSSRVDELALEERRHKLDSSREARIKTMLAALPAGYAETLASEGVASQVPSLSNGSVSPNSSISVAQVLKMESTVASLTAKVASVVAERDASLARMEKEKDDRYNHLKKELDVLKNNVMGETHFTKACESARRVRIHGGDGYSSWDTSC